MLVTQHCDTSVQLFTTETTILGFWLQNNLKWDKNGNKDQVKIVHDQALEEAWFQ